MAGQQISTFLMFEGSAEEAMNFYLSLFDDAEVVSIKRHGAEDPGPEGSVMAAVFTLAGGRFMCSDSFVHHEFTFTPSTSMFVDCADEAELDRLYAALSEKGHALMPLGEYGFSRKFGWVNDRFGVSWQLNLPA
jgi:predicted 3-demethylubiquinone-9 3-methyltransferase (glyoxalase superfamily)